MLCGFFLVRQELARDCVRISKLRLFGDYLCGIDPPLLSYNVETRQYVSAVSSLPATSRTDERGRSEDGLHRKSEQGTQEVTSGLHCNALRCASFFIMSCLFEMKC